MKPYLFITGTLFALIGLTHLGRLIQNLSWGFDGSLSAVSLALAAWAFWLVATARRGAA